MFSFAVLNDFNHYAEYNYAVGVKKIVIFYSLIAVKMHVFFLYTRKNSLFLCTFWERKKSHQRCLFSTFFSMKNHPISSDCTTIRIIDLKSNTQKELTKKKYATVDTKTSVYPYTMNKLGNK